LYAEIKRGVLKMKKSLEQSAAVHAAEPTLLIQRRHVTSTIVMHHYNKMNNLKYLK
jgi:hypothetical protein